MNAPIPRTEIITITGHRDYPDRAALYRGLDGLNAKEYYTGGAKGVDSDALEYLSRTQSASRRTVVVPNRLIDQPSITQPITKQHSSRIIELHNSGPDRYMIRNRYMVDHSDRTVAFYAFRGKGGTYNTIEYALQQGKNVTVEPMQDFTFYDYKYRSILEFQGLVKNMMKYKVPLSSVKSFLIQMIDEMFNMTVEDFTQSIGYDGIKTLEQLWLR